MATAWRNWALWTWRRAGFADPKRHIPSRAPVLRGLLALEEVLRMSNQSQFRGCINAQRKKISAAPRRSEHTGCPRIATCLCHPTQLAKACVI